LSEVAYDEYRRDQYDSSGGYDGPPVPAGYFPPEFRLPMGGGTFQSPIGIPAPPIFPTVRVVPRAAPTGDSAEEAAGDSAIPEADEEDPFIDPFFRPVWTVYERAPGGIYETNRAPTDWDRVYDEYVVLNEPEVTEDVPFHQTIIDWGVDVGAAVFGGILDPVGIGTAIRTAYAPPALTGGVTGLPSLGQQTSLRPATVGATTMPACGPTGPKYGKICLATGEVTPLRRRRRRRLLTSSDIKDLSALKSIVGGAALQAAVVQAVRR